MSAADPSRPGAARRSLRLVAAVLAAVALVVALFALGGWAGSAVPRNAGWQEAGLGEDGTVEIMVESNGVHTALVLPLVAPQKDWREDFPHSDLANPHLAYTHVSISWGEREVFLNTPTWSDLSPMTVARVIGLGGEGLLHVAHYARPAPSANARPLRLTAQEYARLVSAIERAVPPGPLIGHPGYGAQDVFYESPGRYTAVNTCNQWTSDMLAEAGVRTGWWTPFAGGVMKWVSEPGLPG